MVLSCSHVSKSFIEHTVLKDASFHVEDREKVGIVGVNGSGKTTLLRMIIGELKADSGEIVIAKGKTIGYLAQHQNLVSGRSIFGEVLEVRHDLLEKEELIRQLERKMKETKEEELPALYEEYERVTHEFEEEDGYALRSNVKGILKGLGFTEDEFTEDVSLLSGGQKTRVCLGKLLLSKPDVILLDEPTNHLDMDSVAWLENFLSAYPGAVIVVAHDRYFLDRIVTKVLEIEHGTLSVFPGNYTEYVRQKREKTIAQQRAYENQQHAIRHQEEVITKLRSFNREKSIRRAESREKALDRMERIEKPETEDDRMTLALAPKIESGKDVLSVSHLAKSYGDHLLFSDVSIEIKRGERVAVIGKNGTGKTTLLKIINGLTDADDGVVRLGANVRIAYYDQEQHVLDPEKTLFEEMADTYPTLTGTKIRNVLAAFLFTGDDVFRKIGELSGGERGRVSFARLMLSGANFLILDEPTNHLDMVSREVLEQALNRYTGTVLFVSHDRYFINRTAVRILELSGQKFVEYLGNYDYYLEKKEQLSEKVSDTSLSRAAEKKENPSSSEIERRKKKEEQAKNRRRQNEIQKTEEEIEALEEQIAGIDERMAEEEIYTNPGQLVELSKERSVEEERLAALYDKWEELSSSPLS